MLRSILRIFVGVVIGSFIVLAVPTYIENIWYYQVGPRPHEQRWLDREITLLKTLHTDDTDLQGIIDYTIRRYNKIGPWNVMVTPVCEGACAMNDPLCPGITLDPEVVYVYAERIGAIILVHEALHDYYPYYGHGHVTPREKKLTIELKFTGETINDRNKTQRTKRYHSR